MNTQLINSLVQIVNSLTQEERELFKQKLERQKNWQETIKKINEHRAAIHARRNGKPFEPTVDDIFEQMREKRTEQLLQACFTEKEKE